MKNWTILQELSQGEGTATDVTEAELRRERKMEEPDEEGFSEASSFSDTGSEKSMQTAGFVKKRCPEGIVGGWIEFLSLSAGLRLLSGGGFSFYYSAVDDYMQPDTFVLRCRVSSFNDPLGRGSIFRSGVWY